MNIAVLLSGGVDSSVVVHLLCEQGYRPSLFYIKIGRDDADYMDCSAEEDMEMASAIARRYGLSLEVVDLHREYWDQVAAYAIDKIRRGLTPNPDVMCNKLIKFGCFEQRVGKDFDVTATGHYATTVLRDGKTWLGTAADSVKDQTDFLAQNHYNQSFPESRCPDCHDVWRWAIRHAGLCHEPHSSSVCPMETSVWKLADNLSVPESRSGLSRKD